MNPVNCGAIIVLDRKWHGRSVIYTLPTGPRVPQQTLDWLMNYTRETKIPLKWTEYVFKNGVYAGTKLMGYGPPAFVEAVKNSLTVSDIFM